MEKSIFGGINIGNNLVEFPYPEKNLRSFLERILEILGLLWIPSRIILNKTLNTN